ncbi:hypothetical protein SAMN05443572_106459 [Myxococcus fulvus]|uniref:Uncharacterized protein n=1 Tax=Myxococcus fulvus TaxID=33 RepID=A0A511T1T2_MYXFU|nr:hypothetical protein [Myxococcus fulvus]AKF86539.1 hypothetical protein MFUL124B02_29075 [Myxococcus fulvus 124B02]GEN08119.1 hypothetical protein MFU01_31560 [Myxococcus fulvus]SEU22883.1 hypothetical protein SAMN05443572_106459 [Myxococcus fulvus]
MTGPRLRRCATCGRALNPREVYYRFKLVLEGEQDVLESAESSEDGEQDALAALVRRLEEGPEDARELEDQVHWERAGVVCGGCRAVAVRMLDESTDSTRSH